MTNHGSAVARLLSAALLVAAAVWGMGACAQPLVIDGVPAGTLAVGGPAPTAEEVVPPPPTVQLRYFWFSPDVNIVAWVPDESAYGLRSVVRRDGTLVRDHRLFVSSYYNAGMPAAGHALMDTRRLEVLRRTGDTWRCWFGDCSPHSYFSARVPDELLRTRRDSIAVTFYGAAGREMTIALRADLVEAYLHTVDSVRAKLGRAAY